MSDLNSEMIKNNENTNRKRIKSRKTIEII